MIEIDVASIVAATAATNQGVDDRSMVTGDVVHDSRLVRKGDLFVALPGERVDGHDFVEDALAAGAVTALVTQPGFAGTLQVEDATMALADLAREVARRVNPLAFGITGSSGKTSTKDLLGHVLQAFGPTVWPPGSFNNDIGLPLTVLSMTGDTKHVVLEYGARAGGHIARLCTIVAPSVAVVTNVGSAHLGEFGSVEAITSAKTELVEAVGATGVAVLNLDDPNVAGMAASCRGRVRTYGRDKRADVQIREVELDAYARPTVLYEIDGEEFWVELALSGEHQAVNAAAVLAAVTAIGYGAAQAISALATVAEVSKWRMELIPTRSGVLVVNDAYNANPESMNAALRALAAMRGPDHLTWAVLGEMRELGDETVSAHDEAGRRAVRLGIDRLVGIGEVAHATVLGAASEGYYGGEAYYARDKALARKYLREHLQPGDVVLFKGSRGAALEELVDAVVADQGGEVTESAT